MKGLKLGADDYFTKPSSIPELLAQLMRNMGRVMLHRDLLTRVRGAEYQDEFEYRRACILHLRRKLERPPQPPLHHHPAWNRPHAC